MSTEHDQTKPVPTTPPTTPTPGTRPGPRGVGSDPTTPIPRATGREDDPTIALDTSTTDPATRTEPVSLGKTSAFAAPAQSGVSTTLRVGTVVWGLVLAIIGAGVIAIAAGARLDLELAAIALLALAGVALVVGSVVNAARRKH